MKIMVIGASNGLGRALVEGVCSDGDTVVGVSRKRPKDLRVRANVDLQWIEADMSSPLEAIDRIQLRAPAELNTLIYNLGVWEEKAFTDEYSFLDTSDESVLEMLNVNVSGAILLLKRLMPRLLHPDVRKPQVVLTGSTSGLRQSGRPEVTFSASKFALTGIADALRESFREKRLAVTCLQLGHLNTEDPLSMPRSDAAERGDGQLVPMHDVVDVMRALINLSNASFVREVVMPAIRDGRF